MRCPGRRAECGTAPRAWNHPGRSAFSPSPQRASCLEPPDIEGRRPGSPCASGHFRSHVDPTLPAVAVPRCPARSTWTTRMTKKLPWQDRQRLCPASPRKLMGNPAGFQPVGMVFAVLCVLVPGNLTERLCRLAVQFFDSAVQT